MKEPQAIPHSLVLYKGRAAQVLHSQEKKITIETDAGQTLNVRPKDVTLLHVGPFFSFAELASPKGEVRTAWELLRGLTTNLSELAELIFGDLSPSTAWAAWELVADGLYFSGTPDHISAQSAEVVSEELAKRAERAAAEAAWTAFTRRLENGTFEKADEPYLSDVVALALGDRQNSRVLKDLGYSETPQTAHALLLKLGYWDETFNPYPRRAGIALSQPSALLPELPEEERVDLTHLVSLAIDDAGTQDPDDAISWENGRLWVHIADSAALVGPDSPPDLEARARGANLYLPEGIVTMLPQTATKTLGLGLNEVSPALSFGLTMTADGEIADCRISPSWIRVTRLSYEEAGERLAEPPLRQLAELAQVYESKRKQNGAVTINLPEVRVRVREGLVDILPLPSLRSRDLVREAMLMTGEAIARFGIQHGIPLPYTTQVATEAQDINAVTTAEMFGLRRLMKPSQRSSTPAPHAGLGMPLYVQATSPLRRYLDLVVHQQLRGFLAGHPLLDAQAVMARAGAADAAAGSARWAERRSIDHWTLVFLNRHPTWRGEGVIVDRQRVHDIVLIPELAWETRIYRRQELPLNHRVQLALQAVNLAELETQFQTLD